MAAGGSSNVFRIDGDGAITEVIDSEGDESSPLDFPRDLAVDAAGNVYVAGGDSDNAFKVKVVEIQGPRATCSTRNGTGINPLDYQCIDRPILGSMWDSSVFTTPTVGALTAATGVVVGFGGATSGSFSSGFEELVLPPFSYDIAVGAELGSHAFKIPPVPALAGLRIATQGLRLELSATFDPIVVLLNAQDLLLGS